MKKLIALALVAILGSASMSAQITDGRTNDVTLFHDYCPAIITLVNGNLNRQTQANIFLKDNALIYKKGKNVMEANMDVIKSVKFGNRNFIKVGRQLAEVIDSCGENKLVLIQQINIDGLNTEILNSSTVTNLDLGEQIGVTRLDANEDQLQYPVDNFYYFVVGKKNILAHDRETKVNVGRKRMEAYERVVKSFGFSWSDKDCLMQILEVLSRQ